MKEFKIDKSIEQEVESIILLAQQAKNLKDKFPSCWNIILKQFSLSSDSWRNSTPDRIENFKLNLYVEIVKSNNIKAEEKKKAVKKKLEVEE